ncbi:unnamed protein product [Microthlaspi erraticum]|uniref:Uncharacterized protein n=1 Tax=Microthlaspi erraticum TaxID=1685480 RepID=A0A6D2I5E7_9BRAS|nr:unnamed protein product [Microthlaspi erraticum]
MIEGIAVVQNSNMNKAITIEFKSDPVLVRPQTKDCTFLANSNREQIQKLIAERNETTNTTASSYGGAEAEEDDEVK